MTISIEEFYQTNTLDESFDEKLYEETYPDTKDFYQPYCKNNHIDDKYRLYYHWFFYGENTNKGDLAVITSFFNPCNYDNIKSNYIEFSKHIKLQADLFPIELSFNGDFFINDNNCIRIKGTKNNCLWQKEALLNIALKKLPKKYKYVAWIDCDVIFKSDNWARFMVSKLQSHKIVQGFKKVEKINPYNPSIITNSIISNMDNGESGFCWAANREVIDHIKLLDNQVFGGADYIMALTFMDKLEKLDALNRYINNEYTQRWIKKTQETINKSVGYIDTEIKHLYHGSEYNRFYTRVLLREYLTNHLDINSEITKQNDLWGVTSKHTDKVYNFFLSRQEDDNLHIKKFLHTKFDTHEDCLDYYMYNICNNLMMTNPLTITQVKNKLIDSTKTYAKDYSTAYKEKSEDYIFTRKDFQNKKHWISTKIDNERIINQNTSGSTTGEPFNYYTDKKYFDFIQESSEFGLILKEYQLYNKPLKILNLFKHPYNPKPKDFYLETHNHSKSRFHTYGAEYATTFFVNWDGYIEKPDDWHDKFLDLLSNNLFDVVLCSGPVINIFTRYIKKNNFKSRFARLLSHTTEFPRIEDFEFLQQNGNINYYCDHMRCYDGGASFFTCKHGTYHLNDNLSWVVQGPDNKMISTDYFNIIAPFVNYWNGDLCEIKDEYQLCKCGRYYRPFKMLENRPFALKGPTKLTEIRQQIKELNFRNKIDQVQFENLSVNIYTNSELNHDEKKILDGVLKDYKANYY